MFHLKECGLGDEQKDTSLRFIPLDDNDMLFKCPSCSKEIKAPILDEIV
jgi:hypothetical protein